MTTHTHLHSRRAPRGAPAMRVFRFLVASVVTNHMPTWSYVRGNYSRTEAALQTLRSAETLYRAEHPEGPCVSGEQLAEMGYLSRDANDAWNRPIWFKCLRRRSAFVSLGADGVFGTQDDTTGRRSGGRL